MKQLNHQICKCMKRLHVTYLIAFLLFVSNAFAYNPKVDVRISSRMEMPKLTGAEDLIIYTGFTVSYNQSWLIPNWVAYEVTASETLGEVPRRKSFYQDPNYNGRQAQRTDYANSGWDKGHMAPAGDMKWDEMAMIESFYFTNICPQNQSLNEGDWQSLEKKIRTWAKKYGSVFVVCGPIVGRVGQYGYLGPSNVLIPDAFFKVVLIFDGKEYHSIGFIMPNEPNNGNLSMFATSVNAVEKRTGIDFFCNLPNKIEENVEEVVIRSFWGI